MITILSHLTVKSDRENEFRKMVGQLTRTTHAEDEGCLEYVFYTRADNPREAVLYEQWRDAEALGAHIARLLRLLGPPDDDETYPATHFRRRLPKTFLDLLEMAEPVRYEPMID